MSSGGVNSDVNGRVYFANNPWPQGHRLMSFTWGGTLHPEMGLGLHFELQSADYYEGEEDGFPFTDVIVDDAEDWTQKAAWANYHACTIGPSATNSRPGILVSDGKTAFRFGERSYEFFADPLPVTLPDFFETNAFGIYLLGHDAVADHHIRLTEEQDSGSYSVDWTGRIALAYVGETDFRYHFRVQAQGVRFDAISLFYMRPDRAKDYFGVDLDPGLSPLDHLKPYVSDPERFVLEKRNGELFAVRRD